MAQFVVALRISPTEYKALTMRERQALIDAHAEANRKR